jgi:putative transposase
MNITRIAVTNADKLSLFMVDVSQVLMCMYQQNDPGFSILELKAYYRGYGYMTET